MLTQNLISQERKIKLRWFVTLSSLPLVVIVTAFGLMPQSALGIIPSQVIAEDVSLPHLAVSEAPPAAFWRNERVQSGESVAELLRRLSIEDGAASDYLRKSSAAESFRTLPAGREIQAETGASGELISLHYLGDEGTQIVIEKNNIGGFSTKTLTAQLEKRLFVRTGVIKSNLYAATDEADLPDAAANQLTDLFSGDIDFHHDLRVGDKFTVVYEMTYSNGALLHTGRIQAAEFINQRRTYRAVYFQTDAQHGDYYTPEGNSVRKAFLRSPIEFSRISSGFTKSRFHPILNQWRSHKGVDFAAPTGTRVKVTSDGVVTLVGKQHGYGNVIMVSHQGRYSTVYGHLSRFAKGLHKGQHVAQGEIIGYVGMTGLATGPHLHYEFKIAGLHRDPLRVTLPDAKPIAPAYMEAFKPVANDFVSRLDLLRNTNLATLD